MAVKNPQEKPPAYKESDSLPPPADDPPSPPPLASASPSGFLPSGHIAIDQKNQGIKAAYTLDLTRASSERPSNDYDAYFNSQNGACAS
jgi:hypothetical protein